MIQHSDDDGDFLYSDWTAPYRTPAGRDAMLASMRQQNLSLPTVRKVLNGAPFDSVGPDIVEGIRGIKAQDGPDLILLGSSTLTSTLLEHGLADEVMLAVYPVLLGTGKRFFAEGAPPRLFDLVSTQAFLSGIIFSTYKVAGPLKTG